MRTYKLGRSVLEVVTPRERPRYFAVSGTAALRLFWIFRNFDVLRETVLTPRQQREVADWCARPGCELPAQQVRSSDLIGRLELSRGREREWRTFDLFRTPDLSQPTGPVPDYEPTPKPAPDYERALTPAHARPGSGFNRAWLAAAAVVVIVLAALGVVRNYAGGTWWRSADRVQTASLQNEPAQPAVADNAAPHAALPQSDAEPVVVETAATPDAAHLADAVAATKTGFSTASGRAAGTSPANANLAAHREAEAAPQMAALQTTRPAAEAPASTISPKPALPAAGDAEREKGLPAAGPPVKFTMPEFPPVSRDTEIVLRAMVNAQGRVTEVLVVAGPQRLAAVAARSVRTWRYAPPMQAAESRIRFRVATPDAVSVSFKGADADRLTAKNGGR